MFLARLWHSNLANQQPLVLTVNTLKNVFFYYLVAKYTLKSWRHLVAHGPIQTVVDGWRWLSLQSLLLVMRLPSTRAKVEAEIGRARKDIITRLVPQGPNVTRHVSLPSQGQSPQWIAEEMEKMDAESEHTGRWKQGKLSGAVYHGGDDTEKIIVAAFKRYSVSNPLHPDVFPAVRKMEAEIVAMCLRMYNHPDGAGSTTSGGTESILMSCKTHRDWALATKGITEPEMVIATSAHAAFDKAGQYFRIKVIHVPVDPVTREIDIRRVRRAVNRNTIMIVGSAINFPDGIMDDIVALGAIAQNYNIGLHVDCCLGSFIVPFLEKAGFPTKLFDFRVKGVTAISCDAHKYGFAPKGSSIIMYRSAELRQYQYFIAPEWSGGVYASPGAAGSRPGALIAGTWAIMQYIGESGYIQSCKEIVGAAMKIQAAITHEIPELYVLGKPLASVVAFGSKSRAVDVMEVGDVMSTKGWHLNALSNPPAVHIACTRLTLLVVDQFIADLKESVCIARAKPSGKGNMVALYGLGTSSVVGPALVGRLASEFLDALYIA